ncbi:hypothetical protein L3Y34_000480 [Caenorhabditis briggsae]|uniref:Uncharacterized protein n=1 Tax=Caenorhabditis briggsae TaxID=6238 RepID=A0AAE9INW5_CAEBR|nr:hypothetical protein L3Y34_000480 [Caenorhabditis briggsae]
MSDQKAIETAIEYTEDQLKLLDANCLTALSFGENMGRRAKARRRAARLASENLESSEEPSSVLSDETGCEIPSIPSKPSPSRIPVLQKGYQFEKSTEEEKSTKTAIPLTSKIPRPLIFIDRYNVSSLSNTAETSELPSFTQKTGDSFTHSTMVTGTHSATMPPGLSPLPYCSSSSNSSEDIQNQVLVVSEAANRLQMTFDMQKVVSAFGLDFAGIKII